MILWEVETGSPLTVLDGDKKFNVTVATLLSADKDYGEYGPNKDGAPGYLTVSYPFISLDDPDDDSATACPRGMYGFYTDVADTNPLYNDYYGCIKCEPGDFCAGCDIFERHSREPSDRKMNL